MDWKEYEGYTICIACALLDGPADLQCTILEFLKRPEFSIDATTWQHSDFHSGLCRSLSSQMSYKHGYETPFLSRSEQILSQRMRQGLSMDTEIKPRWLETLAWLEAKLDSTSE